jgi:ATP-dependent Clp protease ATP-binding subunit ClpA
MMRPELLNRIDKIIVFRALTKKDIFKIIDLQINDLRSRLQKQGVGLGLEISQLPSSTCLKTATTPRTVSGRCAA